MSGTSYQSAVQAERDRAGRQILAMRLVGLSLWNALNAYYVVTEPAASNKAAAPMLAAYLLFSIGLWATARYRPASRKFTWLALPILDIPVLFTVLWTIMPLSPSPLSLAGTGLGSFLILGTFAQLSLDTRLMAVTGLVSAVALPALWWRAGLASAGPGSVALLATFYVGLFYLPQRLEHLLDSVVQERTQRERLGRYFSPSVADVIATRGPEDRLASYREITVLFADLRGFTSMSERLTPGEVAELLNEVHSAMVDVLFAHGATLDKFMGDGIMAYFSAPITQKNHAELAVRCAIEMQAAMERVNTSREGRLQPVLAMGIGLHTGPAIVGDLGPEQRREYTAIGDTVNLASRMESMTKTVGVDILVTGEVVALADGVCEFQPKGPVQVKGKTLAIETHTPIKSTLQPG